MYIKSDLLQGNVLKFNADVKTLSVNIPKTDKPRVVVIGGGFGGIEAAKILAKNGQFQVVLVDKNNYHTFQPLLYQVATAGLEPDSIAGPLRKIFSGYSDFYFRMAKVDSIQPGQNCINTDIGPIDFDYLIIASGSRTNYYGNDTLQKAAFPMKWIPQALDLRSKILQNFEGALLSDTVEEMSSLLDVVIVGGGPTGVELAGAFSELKSHVLPKDLPEIDFRKMEIYLLEAGPRLLNGMSDSAGNNALKFLKNLGVKVELNTAVKAYDGLKVELANGKTITSQTLIWAAGVMGNILPGLNEEAVIGNRYVVDETLKVKGYPNIFAIGDVAGLYAEKTPRGYPMVAQVAIQQGKRVAMNLLQIQKKEEIQPFIYKDKGSMATIGRNKAVVDLPNFKFSGMFAWFVWMVVHLLFLIGFRNKISVLMGWMWNYFTYDRATRLIIRPWSRRQHQERDNSNG